MSLKFLKATAAAALLVSGVAIAEDTGFYAGGEFQYGKYGNPKASSEFHKAWDRAKDNGLVTGNKIGKAAAGFGVFAGYRFHENVGAELGYSRSLTQKHDASNLAGANKFLSRMRHSNIYADVLGYLPVLENLEVIGSLGLGRLSSKANIAEERFITDDKLKMSSSKVGLRYGAGVQYNFAENISVRLLGTYQKGNALAKSATAARLGVLYRF